MATDSYDKGDKPRLTATFTDITLALFDPTNVFLSVQDPSGKVYSYSYALADITRASTGVYTYDLLLDKSGKWDYRWYSTSDPLAESGSIIARPDPTAHTDD